MTTMLYTAPALNATAREAFGKADCEGGGRLLHQG